MEMEQECVQLRGQIVATQMILVGLCLELRKYNGEGEILVANAFTYADHAIEDARASGNADPRSPLDAALASLEQLGNAALKRISAVEWSRRPGEIVW